jgi:hypothetical protein
MMPDPRPPTSLVNPSEPNPRPPPSSWDTPAATVFTRTGPPYADALPFARKRGTEFPDRVLWGSDWSHPKHPDPIRDDGLLVDVITEMAP